MAGNNVKAVIRLKLQFADLREFISEYSTYLTPDGLIVFTGKQVAPGSLIRFEILSRDGARFLAGEGVVSSVTLQPIESGVGPPFGCYANTVVVSKVAPGGLGVMRAMAGYKAAPGVFGSGVDLTASGHAQCEAGEPILAQTKPDLTHAQDEAPPIISITPAEAQGAPVTTAAAPVPSPVPPPVPAPAPGAATAAPSPPSCSGAGLKIIAASKTSRSHSDFSPDTTSHQAGGAEEYEDYQGARRLNGKEAGHGIFGALARLFSRRSSRAAGWQELAQEDGGEGDGSDSMDMDIIAWADGAKDLEPGGGPKPHGVDSSVQVTDNEAAAPVLNLSSLQQEQGELGNESSREEEMGGAHVVDEKGNVRECERELNRLLAEVLEIDEPKTE